MEQIATEKLNEINKEIQEVLAKHGVTIQPTMGISIVPITKEEIISPLSEEITGNKDEPNQTVA